MGVFAKGITLKAKEALTAITRLETPLPSQVILPLTQSVGDAAEPIVKEGDQVKTGQLIATAPNEHTAPLHAPISGTVGAITEQLTSQGTTVEALTIDSDGNDTRVQLPKAERETTTLSPSEICARIQAAGLITPGLLPVPVAADLVPADQPKTHLTLTHRRVVKAIDTVIITALDPEPMLLVNRFLAGEEHEALPAGVAALKSITGAERILFVVDKDSPRSSQITHIIATDEEQTTMIVSQDAHRFPVGLPVPLIKAVVGREVPLPYGHPRDVGVTLYDLATVIAIGRSVTHTLPQIEVTITVGGGAMSHRGIATVRVGTPIGALIEALGGFRASPAKLILGGPLTGVAHYELTVPVTKEVTGLFALTREEITLTEGYRECINCGRCVKVCPVNLVPGMLSMYCAKERFDTAAHQGLLSCIECGCCDYVCPSRRPMVHLFRHAKHQLMEGRE